ncbi:MAG: class I SAM-dependent methyltransferase [Nitrospinota bacterium]|nr:class I SAM-dependent methyltransferase [Nitrospinota bacterium]
MDSSDYFDNIASQWDGMRQSFFSNSLRDKVIIAAAAATGMTAADIGAGTGFLTSALVERGLRVIAVDQSAQMLLELGKKFPQVDTRQGHGEELPLDDATVDLAVANMYLHHVERPSMAIAEMARILRPDGRLVISDLDRHNHEFLHTEQHDRWMGFHQKDVAEWLQAAGLEKVKVECANEDCQASSSGREEKVKVSIFIASGVKTN